MKTDRVPVTNRTNMPIYVAGVMIPAGETKHFPAHHAPAHLRDDTPEPIAPAAPENPIQTLLSGKVPEIIATLPGMSDEDYAALKQAEEGAAKPRKGLLNAFAEEDLRRANEKAGQQTGETQSTDSDAANATTGEDGDEPTNSADAGQ